MRNFIYHQSSLKRVGAIVLNVIIALFVVTNIHAQDLRIQVDKKGKVGFVDANGTEVIKCEYESAYPFKNGFAIVCKSKKYGIIDSSGKIVLPLKYSQISSWNERLYLIKSGKVMGLAKPSGEIVLEVKYTMISKSNCYGKALIALDGKSVTNEQKTYIQNAKYGIIDDNGKVLIEPQYKGFYEFAYDGKNEYPYHEGKRLLYTYHYTTDTLQTDCSYLGFSKNGMNIYKCGIMDATGKELLEAGLYDLVMKPVSGMVRYYNTKRKETICGYHNIDSGKNLIAKEFEQPLEEIQFWSHGDFIGDIAPVNGETWSFIDKEGNVLREGYQSLKHSEALNLWAAQKTEGSWDVFDEKNQDVKSLSGYKSFDFPAIADDKKVFAVEKDNLFGCIELNGEVAVPFEYEKMLPNTFDVIIVNKEGNWGAITPNNEVIIPFEYHSILFPTERNTDDFWVMKSDSLYYHFSKKENTLDQTGYRAVTNFLNGIAHVAPTDMTLLDIPVNRAQLYSPNSTMETIESAKLEDFKDVFGYLLKRDNTMLMDLPVSTLYRDAVLKEIEKYGDKTLSETDKRHILLEVTKENRSYDLKSVLNEEEWNY